MHVDAITAVLLAMLGGAIRVSTPFLFVSLGETITEKAGRINLGLEGTLVMGAMSAYAASLHSGQPWLGVLAAAGAGAVFGLLHGLLASLRRVNDIALGIALMLLGTGLAFYWGKAYIQPQAPTLTAFHLGAWSDSPALRSALDINPLFIAGLVLAFALHWAFANTRLGLTLRLVGDSEAAARAAGAAVIPTRIAATVFGGALAGVGGAFLSLFYPGSWNEGLSNGQGIMAVALVIFARWQPRRCVLAALMFGAAGAIGPALQSVGISSGYYLFNAAPYALTLLLMALTCSRDTSLKGAPGELSLNR
ncbi:ABC transporter permease [Niveibacterium microcysteis]|uniref:ABC transporter permease n=1 Tax=Niveibacterium microcysteis TaxID=2811415 RepID=A0ABX7LZU6_9RHOO|nr:ABC transporter permease [Niveibacterium microcysteis]QSI75036.1 ABC transporter permease [Niveibacterium microcysteis]